MTRPARHVEEGLATVNRGLEDNLSNPDIEHYIQRAKMGNLPLPRPLKDQEPDKLNDRHITMLFMRATGMEEKRIAELLGYSPNRVCVLLNHPWSQFLLNKMLSYAAEVVIDMEARIKAAGPEALDTVIEVMRDENEKGAVRSKNAFKLIALGGYGAKEERKHVHEVRLPENKAGLLTTAIQEASEIVDAEWHFVEKDKAESDEPGSGQPGESANVGKPPLGSSQPLLPPGDDNA